MKDKKKINIWMIVRLAVFVGLVVTVFILVNRSHEPEVTNTFISNKLVAVSELTSAKMTYNGLVRYSDGDVPFLTQKGFSMIYRAEVKAGIDLSKVKTSVTSTKVTISLPETELLDITVDSDSIEFYDKQFALFNWSQKEDVIKAMKAAKEDVTKHADIEALKSKSKTQTEKLIKGLFCDIIGKRALAISYQ